MSFRYLVLLFCSAFLLSACGGGSDTAAGNTTEVNDTNDINEDSNVQESNSPVENQPVDQNRGDAIDDALEPSQVVTDEMAVRFLTQATFGADTASIEKVKRLGWLGWIEEQFTLAENTPANHFNLTIEIATENGREGFPSDTGLINPKGQWHVHNDQESAWWHTAIFEPDQLRQRVAFALSELLVVSTSEPPLIQRGEALAYYYDTLVNHAFGNYRDLLSAVSKSPAMGIYLSHQGNRVGDPVTGRTPDENYARELMQLFSIGLYDLNSDGTAKQDDQGDLIPSYTQADVENLARVFTGWSRKLIYTNDRFRGAVNTAGGYDQEMECVNSYHDFGSKQLLGQIIAENLRCDEDLEVALDILFAHDNIAPFVSRHLIMRMVTSNPSPDYIRRVAEVFNDNGSGVKGDLGSVVKAILLDEEARDFEWSQQAGYGIYKSPILATTQLLRAFNPIQPNGYAQVRNELITPMRSDSVFNFYLPDHQPANALFQQKNQVSPEAQLFNDLGLVNHYNHLARLVLSREVREKVYRDETNREPAEGLFEDLTGWNNEVHLDLTNQLKLIEQTLSGQEGSGFELLADDIKREAAVEALVDQLNLLLTANRLTQRQQEDLTTYLMALKKGNKNFWAITLAQEAVLMIVSSNRFAIQK